MTKLPHLGHTPSGRVLRIPPRKGLWLFEYDQVKYNTRFQHIASTILGCLALVLAATILWVRWSSRSGTVFDLLFAIAALAYGLVNAPVGIVYWIRRKRGERTELFDYEVVKPGEAGHGKGVDDAANHR